jgi:hypothetical protein
VHAADGTNDGGYYQLPDQLPDHTKWADQIQQALHQRYNNKGSAGDHNEPNEHQLWEMEQTKKTVVAPRKKKQHRNNNSSDHHHDTNEPDQQQQQQYDFILEETIDFVMQGTKKGYDRRRKHKATIALPPTEAVVAIDKIPRSEHEKILEDRTKLPVFVYRQDFLAAVKNHQVLILVSETGSRQSAGGPGWSNPAGKVFSFVHRMVVSKRTRGQHYSRNPANKHVQCCVDAEEYGDQ